MKHFKTDSDIGCVLIGNEEWTWAVPNIGGDGETDVFISEKEDIKFKKENYNNRNYIVDENKCKHWIDYISTVQGKVGIYNYDCAFSDKEALKNPIEILEGRYAVYNSERCVVFVKWK